MSIYSPIANLTDDNAETGFGIRDAPKTDDNAETDLESEMHQNISI
jgi:hypothetical protein